MTIFSRRLIYIVGHTFKGCKGQGQLHCQGQCQVQVQGQGQGQGHWCKKYVKDNLQNNTMTL